MFTSGLLKPEGLHVNIARDPKYSCQKSNSFLKIVDATEIDYTI